MARTPHAGIGGQLVERYLHYAICAACGMRQGGLRSRRLTTTTTTRLCVCVRGARVVADVRCVLSIRLKLKTCLTQVASVHSGLGAERAAVVGAVFPNGRRQARPPEKKSIDFKPGTRYRGHNSPTQ
eukprot:scaffold51055_cov376-Isochrysis_galbana.AAC.1